MKIKTADLIGPALDWMVAVMEGLTEENGWTTIEIFKAARAGGLYWYSTDWGQGGPIIEREELGLRRNAPCSQGREWEASPSITAKGAGGKWGYGPTPLIAAMRCYCCAKLGEYVDIPEELCQRANS